MCIDLRQVNKMEVTMMGPRSVVVESGPGDFVSSVSLRQYYILSYPVVDVLCVVSDFGVRNVTRCFRMYDTGEKALGTGVEEDSRGE